MNPTQFLLMAFEGMFRHKLRTFLTLLGLIVGIASVLVMTGIGRGFEKQQQQWMASLLPNKITVYQGYSPDAPPTQLTLRLVEVLQSRIGKSAISAVAPNIELYDVPIQGIDRNTVPVSLIATSPDYQQTNNLKLGQGRFFNADEVANSEYVAVVNQTMLTVMQGGNPFPEGFGGPGPVMVDPQAMPTPAPVQLEQTQTQLLFINGLPFRIVGVVDETDNVFSFGMPQIFIPVKLLGKHIRSQSLQLQDGSPVVNMITILASDVDHIEEAKREIERILRLANGLRAEQMNNFEMQVDQEITGGAEEISQAFTMVLAGIGAISLVVGGIGIMNILLATVAERTREIGVRKAIGASDFNILAQFLIESVSICLVGGAMGVGLSYAVARIIDYLGGGQSQFGVTVVIDYQSVLIASASSIICGVVFGLYPAIRAMRLDPIQALRYE